MSARKVQSLPTNGRGRYLPLMGEVSAKHVGRSTEEMRRKRKKPRNESSENFLALLTFQKRLCAKCGSREVYQDIKTMDWCEERLWNLIASDQEQNKLACDD